eukprot:Gregarina_sp_Pseudo_9__1751@NODE_218_length_3570_cov_188_812518_g203_i0_p2_GENE_NODE_218_length_3570_cov_188_812518_g203_i0NODE_218_length_3570_cov_188_812518_g203_i0_p2_ORF_typecomplete_len306_score30_42Phage_head_fibr/PF11133_8/0_19_NODE_218_length_3570_cov_188_812518_g203_i018842801
MKQSACESVRLYFLRYLANLDDVSCDMSTVDTENGDRLVLVLSSSFSVEQQEHLSIPETVVRFIKGLKSPRCREFVTLRRPQTSESAFLSAQQFEFCYAHIPSCPISDETAMGIKRSRDASLWEYDPLRGGCSPPAPLSGSPPSEQEGEVADHMLSGRQDLGGAATKASETTASAAHDASTLYFNSLLGRLEASGTTKQSLERWRTLFQDLQRNHVSSLNAGVREQEAREWLDKNRKYLHDHERHELHPYETHITIEVGIGGCMWNFCYGVPIAMCTVRKPDWMRKLYHRLPVSLSVPGFSDNPG